jgi:hypothetical protein
MQTETSAPSNDQTSAAPAADANQVTTPPANGAEQPGAPAATEAPAAKEGESGEPQAKPEGSAEGDEEHVDRDEQGRFKPKLQRRIDELTRQRHQAERDRDYWRAQAEARQAPAAPKPDDFASDDEYQQALRCCS